MAGIGKSAIAKSFCQLLESRRNVWMVTFFASRSSNERRDGLNVIHTFAYDLAFRNEVFRKFLLAALQSHPDVRQRPMWDQVRALLSIPLAAAISADPSMSLIMVIDALDELDKIEEIEGGGLVRDMANAFDGLPVKLVVASRLHDSLRGMFNSLPLTSVTTRRLHEIEQAQVAADIQRVYKQGFHQLTFDRSVSARTWPIPADLDALTYRTGHLFVLATTVIKHVGDRRFAPRERLRRIVDRQDSPSESSPYREVDLMYETTLLSAIQDQHGTESKKLGRRVRDLIATVILAQEPLAVSSLATLLDSKESLVKADIQSLSAVLLFDLNQVNPVIRIFHPCFRDYLMERCNDSRFVIDSTLYHHHLGRKCLLVTAAYLESVTHRSTSGDHLTLNATDIPELVQYAAYFWGYHLKLSSTPQRTLVDAFKTWSPHLISWLKLLRCMNRQFAVHMILEPAAWCQVCFLAIMLCLY